jgi:phthiocerol/phenolphthiocerol synthesis type-I polyketide synthase C
LRNENIIDFKELVAGWSDPSAVRIGVAERPKKGEFVSGFFQRVHLVSATSESSNDDAIAIVGMSCRLPGADNLEEFWRLLQSGTDAIVDIPPDRWDAGYYFHPNPKLPGKMYVRGGGFLRDVDKFDAAFFGIAPREAQTLDPQQRILLELTWEALENADIVPASLAGSDTAVFVGVAALDFGAAERSEIDRLESPYLISGSAASVVANRISYIFDFRGPSMSIDTACSSSLVAMHEACMSLRSGESGAAIVGGINLILLPENTVGFCKATMLSPSSRCQAFDANADGYVRSEGGGVIVLKRLKDALAQGDPIVAVVRGTGVNSDGRTKGLALPSPAAQELLLRRVYATAGIDPVEVAYVEAHGTGTIAGDRAECTAIGNVFGAGRRSNQPCLIGSVKTNIGHLEPAAGMAGIIKAVLSLQNREIPPSLHLRKLNPEIPFDQLNLAVASQRIPLTAASGSTVVGVNSFGFGGTNAHVVLSDTSAPARQHDHVRQGTQLLALSARSDGALKEMAARYAKLLRSADGSPFDDVCNAAATRRSHHTYRLATFGKTSDEVATSLECFVEGQEVAHLAQGVAGQNPGRLAFVFSGNGSQWVGMGHDLFRTEPAFAKRIAEIDAVFQPLLGWSLRDLFTQDAPVTTFDSTLIAQPALFAIQVGIVEVLRSRGMTASALVGHSVGEVAAAHVAGILSLEQAALIMAVRSTAAERTAGAGGMAAVGLSAAQTAEIIAPYGAKVTIAAINSPASVTLAGDTATLAAIGKELEAKSVFFRALPVNYAFHSAAMDPLRDEILRGLHSLAPSASQTQFVSTVTGDVLDGTTLNAAHWWDNVRKPVQFAAAIARVAKEDIDIFVEIGPHPVLGFYLHECLRDTDRPTRVVATLRRNEPEQAQLWLTLAQAYSAGFEFDYTQLFPELQRRIILPSYPWQREHYWYTEEKVFRREHPLLHRRIETSDAIWLSKIDPIQLPFLADHVVRGSVVFPFSGYVETAIAAGARCFETEAIEIEELEVLRPLPLRDDGIQNLEIALSEDSGSFRVHQRNEASAALPIAVARVAPLSNGPRLRSENIERLRGRLTAVVDAAEHYRRCAARGIAYGPAFQGVVEVWAGDGEALGRIALPNSVETSVDAFHLHPALLDGAMQVALHTVVSDEEATYLPVSVGRIRIYGTGGRTAWCHATHVQSTPRSHVGNLTFFDDEGAVVAQFDRMRLRRLESTNAERSPTYHWQALFQGDASDFPEPARLKAMIASDIAAIERTEYRDEYYREVSPKMNRLAAVYARHALTSLPAAKEPFTATSLARSAGAGLEYVPYLTSAIAAAHRYGFVQPKEDHWTLKDCELTEDPDAVWRQMLADHPGYFSALTLIARSGDRLMSLLRGQINSTAPSPEQKAISLGQLYDSDPVTRIYSRVVERMVARLVQNLPLERTLRVLEVGNEAGGIVGAIIDSLPGERTDYVFAALSADAKDEAESRLSGCPFASVISLDTILAPENEAEAGYDIIVTSHLSLDVADPRGILTELRTKLKPGGLLLLLELQPNELHDFVTGVQSQAGADPGSVPRPASPLLRPAAWELLLRDAGFAQTSVVDDGAGGDDATAAIVVARNVDRKDTQSEFSAIEPRTWLVFTDHLPDSDSRSIVIRRLTELGHRVIVVRDGDAFKHANKDGFELPAADADAYDELVAALPAKDAGEIEILYMRPTSSDTPSVALDPVAEQDCLSLGFTLLCRAAIRAGSTAIRRLTVITAGAMLPESTPGALDPAQAPLWGVGRVAMAERPELAIRLVDIDPSQTDETGIRAVLKELLHPDSEDEVILRNEKRYVNRLLRGMLPAAQSSDKKRDRDHYRLSFDRNDAAHRFSLEALPPADPGPDDVVVRVRAAGLNFRDVLQWVGVLPDEAFEGGFSGATLGMEFSGEVIEVGSRVEGFAPGDAVFGVTSNAFSSHLVVKAANLFLKPPSITFEAAATMPVAVLTVLYSLRHVAHLERGERILVHGGAGGVGLAAIQFAQWIGAEVFASAGTPEKRSFLRRLGVPHVLDSRTLGFADAIRQITNDEGVDVVLNSLAGDALHKSLSILRSYGRFVELGKRDFYANTKLGLRPFRNNIQFSGVDLDQLLSDRPVFAASLVKEAAALIAEGVFRPLPHRVFPVSRAADAFRHMQQSLHTGKVVLRFDDTDAEKVSVLPKDLILPPDATFLVTGGRTGFGLATAQFLVSKGARNLVLLGRRPVAETAADSPIAQMRAAGVAVHEVALDVTDKKALGNLLEKISRTMPPLRGIFHCAVVIDDAALGNMTASRFRRVLRPQILGARNLDRLTRNLPIDYFVLYSSAITLVGNPGQANYAAAKLYLETLAHQRRAAGCSALVVSWGAISDVGHLAANSDVGRILTERFGVKFISPQLALERMAEAMVMQTGYVAIADFDWRRAASLPFVSKSPKYALFMPNASSSEAEEVDVTQLRAQLAALPAAEAYERFSGLVIQRLAGVLRMPETKLNPDQRLIDLGLDSLMLAELQIAMEKQFAISISLFDMMEIVNIDQLIRNIYKQMNLVHPDELDNAEPSQQVAAE